MYEYFGYKKTLSKETNKQQGKKSKNISNTIIKNENRKYLSLTE